MSEVRPETLLGSSGRPRSLRCEGPLLSQLTRRYPLRLVGEDRAFSGMALLSNLAQADQGRTLISYLASDKWGFQLNGITGAAIITTEPLRALVPPGNQLLITAGNPQEVFYTILHQQVAGLHEKLQAHIDSSAVIEPSAVIAPHVWIEADAYVGHNAVIMANSYLGRGVHVKPNATVGGDGFEPKTIAGQRWIAAHAGGVWLADGVEVGSSTCIDRGLFGEFTYLGRETKVDNLVHVAHSVTTGEGCCFVACAEISGSVRCGDGVWLGPHVSVNQQLSLGSYCYVGTGGIVTRDLPAHALAYGSPAKQHAWVCVCRQKLNLDENKQARCACQRVYQLTAEGTLVQQG